eukprot:1710178-Heterocapsa_arctica.AAC.1
MLNLSYANLCYARPLGLEPHARLRSAHERPVARKDIGWLVGLTSPLVLQPARLSQPASLLAPLVAP